MAIKVGSHVILIDDNWPIHKPNFELCRMPKKGKIYSIREIVKSIFGVQLKNGPSIRLNEIVNPKLAIRNAGFVEPVFKISRFKELLPLDLAFYEIENVESVYS